MSRYAYALCVACAVLSPALAIAQNADNKAAAEALFAEGRKLMDAGKYAEACKKLEGSQKLDPGAGTLINLAACYEQNGQTASAWATYKEAAIASQARHPDWTAQANARVLDLEPKLARLTITIEKPTPGIVVTRDGATIESSAFGVAIPVDPGAHAIEASAPGHATFHQDIKIAAKDSQSVAIPELQVGESTPTPTKSGSGQRIVGGTMMAVGGVGLVVGAIMGVVALGKKSDASNPNNCTPDFKTCSPVGKGLVDDAKSAGLVSTVAFIAGGVLAAGGLVLFIVAPHGETPIRATAGAEGSPLGLTLRGTF
jgi:hypothetical protein